MWSFFQAEDALEGQPESPPFEDIKIRLLGRQNEAVAPDAEQIHLHTIDGQECALLVPHDPPEYHAHHHTHTESVTSAADLVLATPHRFTKAHFGRPTFCNYCAEFIWGLGSAGHCCVICKYAIHKRCLKDLAGEAPPTCQMTSLPSLWRASLPRISSSERTTESPSSCPRLDVISAFRAHHWLETNVEAGIICDVCEGPISPFGFKGLRCSRCTNMVHKECLEGIKYHACVPLHSKLIWMPEYPAVTHGEEAGDRELPLTGQTPLIVFMNSKSSGQGIELKKKFLRYLGPNQVFELTEGGPAPGLLLCKNIPNLRILACGGDGTVAWVLEYVCKAGFEIDPPVGVLPLGTGNDMARTLGWGGGYDGEKLQPILRQLEDAEIVHLDRWQVTVTPKTGEEPKTYVMNNYFSVGVDAHIALQFHELRETLPQLCSTRLGNKLFYANFGLKTMVEEYTTSMTLPLISELVKLEVDGLPVDIPSTITGLSVINLSSYMGGCNLWGTGENDGFIKPSIEDGLLEVVGLSGTVHMTAIQINLASAQRIAQGKVIRVEWITGNAHAMQVDGEPKLQNPCVVEITHYNKSRMLKRRTAMTPRLKHVHASLSRSMSADALPTAHLRNQHHPQGAHLRRKSATDEADVDREELHKDREDEEDDDEDEDDKEEALVSPSSFALLPLLLPGQEQYTALLNQYDSLHRSFCSLFLETSAGPTHEE